jgi:CheY-like chemotaxis protein
MAKPRVLVVEDNDANRELVEDLLHVAGYEVVSCASGEEGVAWLGANRPDLILMDVNLPGQDGVSLTRQIKARPETCDLPVVALTAYAMRGDRDRILAAGCDGYISKPIDVSLFGEQVAHYLNSSSRHQSPGPARESGAA